VRDENYNHSGHTSVLRPKPCRASTSFHPLPPVPSSSSLQLPSFSNYNFYSSTPTRTSTPPPKPITPTPPSPVLSALRHPDIALPLSSQQETLDPDEDEYHIPAFQHPNSPYVPWAPPLRREILCPPTPVSFISSEYSRSYSRSGARAPEPVESTPEPHTQASKVHIGWRTLGQAFKKNAKHVAKRITSLTNPFKAVASHISASASPGSRIRERNFLRKQFFSHASPYKAIQTSPIRSPSVGSFDSGETTTLATWLDDRRRLSLERDYDPQSMMSLEEYEQTGSWINVARLGDGSGSSCGVPDCRLHTPPSLEQITVSPWRNRQSRSDTITSPQSPQSRSFPHLSCVSPWASEHDVRADFGSLGRKGREMSMPGGWTFGS